MKTKGWYKVANTFTADWIRNHINEELVFEMTDGTIHLGRVHTLYKNAVKLQDGVRHISEGHNDAKLFFNKIKKVKVKGEESGQKGGTGSEESKEGRGSETS